MAESDSEAKKSAKKKPAAFLYDKYNNVMMEVTAFGTSKDSITMRGKMMGTMPSTVYVRPDQVRNLAGLITWEVVKFVPGLLWRAFRSGRAR